MDPWYHLRKERREIYFAQWEAAVKMRKIHLSLLNFMLGLNWTCKVSYCAATAVNVGWFISPASAIKYLAHHPKYFRTFSKKRCAYSSVKFFISDTTLWEHSAQTGWRRDAFYEPRIPKDVPLPLERKIHVNQIGGSTGGANLQWQSKAQAARFFRRELTAVSTAVRPVPTVQIQCHLRTRQTAAWNESRDS